MVKVVRDVQKARDFFFFKPNDSTNQDSLFTPSEMLEMRQRVGMVPAPGVGVLTLQWGDLCMGNHILSLVRQATDLAEEPGKWRR